MKLTTRIQAQNSGWGWQQYWARVEESGLCSGGDHGGSGSRWVFVKGSSKKVLEDNTAEV